MARSTAERPEWGIGGLAQQANTAFAVGAVVVTLLGLQGFGAILPGEIGMRNARLGGIQGVLQLSIVFVMVGLRSLV